MPTPTVNAVLGTLLMSLSKKRLFATMVSYAYTKNGGRATYQCLHTGTRAKRGAGLIEGNVAIRTNAAEEEFDTSIALNLRFVIGALSKEIRGVTIQNVNVLRTKRNTNDIGLRDINMLEKVSVHERVIAFGMVHGKVNILVHIEGHHVLEGDLLLLVRDNQPFIHTDWRGSSGETFKSCKRKRITKNKGSFGSGVELVDTVDHIVGNIIAKEIVVLLNNKTHD